MKRCLLCFLIACAPLIFTSCQQKNKETAVVSTPIQKAIPLVAITPIIDSTNFDLCWSLSDELTSFLNQKIENNSGLNLSAPESIENELSFSHNPFGSDLSWIKKSFNSQEFVVFLELIQHEMNSARKNNTLATGPLDLDMGLRIRIVDLRGKKPAIVLQELIQHSYFISQTLAEIDYNQIAWGSKKYTTTPLYHAHLELLEEAAKRISAYIHP